MIQGIKNDLACVVKNSVGWRTNRRIIVFEVDDYGNVRLDSKIARDSIMKSGVKLQNRYDYYDSLETTEDLEILYSTLCSFRDCNGNPAVFTVMALPANIDFERIQQNNYESYFYEPLPVTFSKLKGYERTWDLWLEGMKGGYLSPEFHGREHLNLKLFKENLVSKDRNTFISLNNRSYTGILSKFKTISFSAAFDFVDENELGDLKLIMEDGLKLFEKVFMRKATHFNAPGGRENTELHSILSQYGVRSFVMPIVHREHLGNDNYRYRYYYTGKKNSLNQISIVRNAVFEPGEGKEGESISKCLRQISLAFKFNCPAIISSHRVNFCGNIDTSYRTRGINALSLLLKQILKNWPEAEFFTTSQLTREILT